MGSVTLARTSKPSSITASLRPAAVLILACAQIGLSVILFQRGFQADASDAPMPVRNPASPAGYAFAVWGVIYLGCLGLAVLQALPSRWASPFYRRIGWWAAAGFALCCGWLFAARMGPVWLTMPVIAAMLLVLGRAFVLAARSNDAPSPLDKHLTTAALAIYAGWLSAATFVNFADVAPGYGFDRFGLDPETFGRLVLMMAAGTALSFIWLGSNRLAYVATVCWALGGIIAANSASAGSASIRWLAMALLPVLIVAFAAQRLVHAARQHREQTGDKKVFS